MCSAIQGLDNLGERGVQESARRTQCAIEALKRDLSLCSDSATYCVIICRSCSPAGLGFASCEMRALVPNTSQNCGKTRKLPWQCNFFIKTLIAIVVVTAI